MPFTPIVIQGLARWDNPYTATILSLAKCWAQNRPVVYVEHPFTYKDLWQTTPALERRKKLWIRKEAAVSQPFDNTPQLHYVMPQPIIPFNFLPPGQAFEWARLRAAKKVWAQVEQQLQRMSIYSYIYINSFDPLYALGTDKQGCLLRVYHCVDFMGGEPYIARHGVEAERQAASQADLLVATSSPLCEQLKSLQPEAYVVPNGAEYAHFAQRPELADKLFTELQGPKVLYVGSLDMRTDYALVAQLAQAHPEVHFLFAGPTTARHFEGDVWKPLANIHLLGSVSYEQVPAYIHAADACIIPFRCTELTRCISALKVNEYLAAGKAVLTTPFTDFEELTPLLYRFSDVQSFSQQLEQALQSSSQAPLRQRAASANSWIQRAADWDRILAQYLPSPIHSQ